MVVANFLDVLNYIVNCYPPKLTIPSSELIINFENRVKGRYSRQKIKTKLISFLWGSEVKFREWGRFYEFWNVSYTFYIWRLLWNISKNILNIRHIIESQYCTLQQGTSSQKGNFWKFCLWGSLWYGWKNIFFKCDL